MIDKKLANSIIDKLIENIREKGRCKGSLGGTTQCLYYTNTDGVENGCAVGLFLKDKYRNKQFANTYSAASFISLNKPPEELFKKKYLISDPSFWENLQDFHDSDCHWDDKELNTYGEYRLIQLKKYFKLLETEEN